MKKKPNIQSLFKKWIVKRPKGMCQILFSLTELDSFCYEIENQFKEDILDMMDIIEQEMIRSSNPDEKNGYAHSYAIVKTLLK